VTEISPSGVKDTTYSIGVGEDGQVGIWSIWNKGESPFLIPKNFRQLSKIVCT
jgi:hypothetical protein